MPTTTTMAELPGLKGSELGVSDWHEVTQEHVNLFADATGDHQWIHVDVERARAESPFGGLQLTLAAVVEREGGDKPVCIAEPVYRYYGG
jgi:acyl dehydratase